MVNFYLLNIILATAAIFSAIVALGLFGYVLYNQPGMALNVRRNSGNAQVSTERRPIQMESLEPMSRAKRDNGVETATSTVDYIEYQTIEPLAEKVIVQPECQSSSTRC
ncbi:unnamed protein product [Bursaphelenchus okinawaensis]|uniref:Uncharacterized protein n=1 Tax=Bursaphelenchus okinawaensis TaxID=465554 RepID=A0A811JUG9_9BILA|nr:unnamed protein product [Bursaphelenchus okinawaensis]CAG9083104.1 unnamed protein product [Bursaphelenchus okinawaensis]